MNKGFNILKKKTALLIFILFFFFFIIFFKETHYETNLIKTLLPERIENAEEITSAANKSAAVIKLYFEGGENQKEQFLKKADYDIFEINKIDVSKFLEAYKKTPAAFLSDKDRNLLKNRQYEEIYNKALNRLYNPIGISIIPFDKDPYFLNTDFLLSNKIEKSNEENTIELKIKDKTGQAANKAVSKLLADAAELSREGGGIYAAGAPVHAYYTEKNASCALNIISILSVLFICAQVFFYFKSFKILIPILCSTAFGLAAGFSAVKLFFSDFQVLTMLFSVSIIGLGIDYSFHYFFSAERNKNFIKNLAAGLITTIAPYILLYFTGIELLRQTAVFSSAALAGIYFFVIVYYPCFKNFLPQPLQMRVFKAEMPKAGAVNIISAVFIISAAIGLFNLHFDDSPQALYSPSKELIKAEKLYNEAAKYNNVQLIAVKGKSIEEIKEKEEAAAEELKAQGINYASISKFIPSKKRQIENIKLVQELYKSNLDNFSAILSNKQIQSLKTSLQQENTSENFSAAEKFMLNGNTSIMYIFSSAPLNIKQDGLKIINIKNDIEKYLKEYRESLLKIMPAALAAAAVLLSAVFGIKRGLKILMPPFSAIVISAGAASFIQGGLNFFSIAALFLVLGFTIDCGIFLSEPHTPCREASAKSDSSFLNRCRAVSASAAASAFSFFLLSFAPFKLISSISFVLLTGVIISYLMCRIMFINKEK